MILRKPYAFLIRHFKLIHIILTALMILFFVKMRSLVSFLKEYISTNTYERVSGVISEYIGLSGFVLPIIIIGIITIIIWLLLLKKKPVKYYVATILTYLLEFILVIISYIALNGIEHGNVNVTFIQIFTDFFDALTYVMIPFVIVSLTRGVGFNIKQFNFKKDLIELNIDDKDSEEFELEVDVDTEDIKAKINRRIRFIKYIYLENKPVFYSIGIAFILSIVILIFVFINSIEKIYKEKESFKAYGVNVVVNNSYKTKYGCNGELIRKDKFYIVVEMSAENTLNQEIIIPYDKIYLRVDEQKKYSPIDTYKDEFSDFGLRYLSTDTLKELQKRQIVLVYEIDNQYFDNSFRFEYLTSKSNKEKDGNFSYTKVDLKPNSVENVEIISEKKIGDVLSFEKSLISGTKLKIEEAEYADKFSYTYTQNIGGINKEFKSEIRPTNTTTYKKQILKLKVDLTTNKELNQLIYNNFYEKFANLEYESNKKIIKQKTNIIEHKTKNKTDYIYLEVVSDAQKSNYSALVFTIRDKEYKYILVDKREK